MLPSVTEKNPPAKVENPIPVIRKVRKMGLLDLVLPFGKEVSEACFATNVSQTLENLPESKALECKERRSAEMLE